MRDRLLHSVTGRYHPPITLSHKETSVIDKWVLLLLFDSKILA